MERLKERFPELQNDETFLYRLGELYLDIGDRIKSTETLKILMDQFPDGTRRGDTYSLLGKLNFQDQKYSEAIRNCRLSMIKREPERLAEVYYILGSSYWRQKEYVQALKAYEKVQEDQSMMTECKTPDHVLRTDRYAKGDLQYILGQYKQSIQAYKQALAEFPDDENAVWAQYRIGLIQSRWGSKETGLQVLNDAEKTDNPEPLNQLIQDAVEEIALKQKYPI